MPILATKETCTGCTACAAACPQGCITMTADENGFLYPGVRADRCVECGLCGRACPVLTPRQVDNAPKAYAAYSKDQGMRLQSSSGGIFTELAKAVLAGGGVVFGAAYNERFEVVHICVDNEAELAELRGAKYAQSDLRGVFPKVKAHLEQGRRVLFCGTPCQVGGLKAYLPKDYEELVTVDFVCHSVPSPVAWREYVKRRAAQDNGGELPLAVNLRSKETGWSRYQYSNLFRYANGKSYSAKSGESLYMKLFVGGYISRDSCTNCQFKGYSRVSDLTIGDFWGIWDIAPQMDDNKGTSVILAQSFRGAQLLSLIADRLVLTEVAPEEASCQNPAMLRPSAPNGRRKAALALIRNGRLAECGFLFAVKKPSHTRVFLQKVKGLLRM